MPHRTTMSVADVKAMLRGQREQEQAAPRSEREARRMAQEAERVGAQAGAQEGTVTETPALRSAQRAADAPLTVEESGKTTTVPNRRETGTRKE